MMPNRMTWTTRLVVAGLALSVLAGCQGPWRSFYQQPTASPLGSISDPIWQAQEEGAELADFIVYDHEFEGRSVVLNTDGQDHLKQIAARLHAGQDALVTVERSRTAARPDTKYQYPIHVDPELDMRRREVVVLALSSMGVPDAEERVVVAPSFATGMTAAEAAAAYQQGVSNGSGFGGFFFGGFGGMGGGTGFF